MMPIFGLTFQFGLAPRPLEVNCWVPDGLKLTTDGLTLSVGVPDVFRVMVAVAVCAAFAMLATVSIIVCNVLIVTGAVYTPFAIVPTCGASVHVTAVDGVPPIEAVN